MDSKGSSPNDYNKSCDDTPKRKVSQSLHGRSARELDEEIIRLRNENFNLKLRLHFKEQVNEDGARANTSNEALANELEDAKSVIHALRLEVGEKTQLLKDAADAISEHEDKEREFVMESQAKIAELEGYVAHLQDEKPLEALFAKDLKRMEEKLSRQADDLHKAKRQIEQLKRELSERDKEILSYEEKLKESTAENSDMMSLLQQHYRFSLMANQMMEIQKKELDACLVEKLGFIKKMNDILPELNCQNELLKEATITVQNLLDTTDLKESFSRELLANYKAAIMESKVEIHNITEDIIKWTQSHGLDCASNMNVESSSSSSQINSEVSSQDLLGSCSAESSRFSHSAPVEEDDSPQPAKVRSSGKHLRGHAKSSFTGLRQFVKCWGRQYSK
ncbi:centrosomin-like [Drosophila novamexicana]|uniref:centrosomin-like n=1 Tax=Drosophila novamexicana TaxID=47314 RepID=UPI0011E5D97B|nr:centrosomin-like [Drosophila novamexicana]